MQDSPHEYGNENANSVVIIGAANGSTAANEGSMIFAVDHFKVVHLNEIDVRFDKGAREGCR